MMTLEATDLYGLLLNSLSIAKEKAAPQRISLELKVDQDLTDTSVLLPFDVAADYGRRSENSMK
jgi:hypothetical protein